MKSIIGFLGVVIGLIVMSCEGSQDNHEFTNVEYKAEFNVEEGLINESLSRLKIQSDTFYSQLDAYFLTEDSLNIWNYRTKRLKRSIQRAVNYLVLESSEMIEIVEQEPWHVSDVDGCLTLKGLSGIKQKDNWDAPMSLFVMQNGGKRGRELREMIHVQRDSVCSILGSYSVEGEDWRFEPTYDGESLVEFDLHARIISRSSLNAALENCNPKDTSQIANIYMSLSQPKFYKNHEDTLSWEATMFDHCPLIAAASIFNCFIVDVRNTEHMSTSFICEKVGVE